MDAVDTALLFGYVLALPFTVFVPGFLRLWRRREVELLLLTLVGLAVVSAAWAADDRPLLGALHAAAFVGLAVAYVMSGRTAQA